MDRREFLKTSAAVGAAAMLPISILPETKSAPKVWIFLYGKETAPGCWDGCNDLLVWFENNSTSPDMFDVCVVGQFANGHRYRCWEGKEQNILTSVQPEDEVIKKEPFKYGPLYAEICTIRHAAILLFAARGFRPSHWPKPRKNYQSQLYVPDNWAVPKVMVDDMRSYENE